MSSQNDTESAAEKTEHAVSSFGKWMLGVSPRGVAVCAAIALACCAAWSASSTDGLAHAQERSPVPVRRPPRPRPARPMSPGARHPAPVYRVAAPCDPGAWPDPPDPRDFVDPPDIVAAPRNEALARMAQDVEVEEDVRSCAEIPSRGGAPCRELLLEHLRRRLPSQQAMRQYPTLLTADGHLSPAATRGALTTLAARRDPALAPLWSDALSRRDLADVALNAIDMLGNVVWVELLSALVADPRLGPRAVAVIARQATDPGRVLLDGLGDGPVSPALRALLLQVIERSGAPTREALVQKLVHSGLDGTADEIAQSLRALAAITGVESDVRTTRPENANAWGAWWEVCSARRTRSVRRPAGP